MALALWSGKQTNAAIMNIIVKKIKGIQCSSPIRPKIRMKLGDIIHN